MTRVSGGPSEAIAARERELIRVWVKLSPRHRDLVIRYAKRLANLPRRRP